MVIIRIKIGIKNSDDFLRFMKILEFHYKIKYFFTYTNFI